jgi:AraC-like DNA-binding protein
MLVLPVPMVVALLLAAFLASRWVRGDTQATLLVLVGICALQSAITALVQHYGVAAFRPLQPFLATAIPPAAWLAFQRAAGGATEFRALVLHLAGPLAALACLFLWPSLLDMLIPLSFTAYGMAMLLRLTGGEASLPHSRLDAGASSIIVWRVVALTLIGSAVSDALVAWGMARGTVPDGGLGLISWIPSFVSTLPLLAIGALGLTSAIESRRDPGAIEAAPSSEDIERDAALLALLDTHLATRKPHLDPDLTLARLSRQLGVPSKQLSAAINRGHKENVSRTINRVRIEEACALLKAGSSVTEAMLASGFNTKSNFNREFSRVKSMNPSQWLSTLSEPHQTAQSND